MAPCRINRILIRACHNPGVRQTRLTTVNQLRGSDYGWLGLAVFLHTALLLVPVADRERPESAGTDGQVSVSLMRPHQEKIEPGNTIVRTPEPISTRAKEMLPPDKEPTETSESPPAGPTARQLIESMGRIERFPEDRNVRRLGEFDPPAPPRNWLLSIAVEDNRLDGVTLPARTKIVDRWLAADGSHNVLIRIAGGETLCGRGQPWDPLRPLVEPVMMYRPCGRGKTRSFDMPARYKRTRP